MSRKNDIKKLISKHQRRLQIRREQKAELGILADPSIFIEIEDLEAEIEKLQTELREIEAKEASVNPSTVASLSASLSKQKGGLNYFRKLSSRPIFLVVITLLIAVGLYYAFLVYNDSGAIPSSGQMNNDVKATATEIITEEVQAAVQQPLDQISEISTSVPVTTSVIPTNVSAPITKSATIAMLTPTSIPSRLALATSQEPAPPTSLTTSTLLLATASALSTTTPFTPTLPTETPVLEATATPASLPSAAPRPALLTATPTITPTPVLPDGTFASLHILNPDNRTFGLTHFEWNWYGPKPADTGFEIRVWRDGEPQLGAHDAVLDNQQGQVKQVDENTYRLSINISQADGVKNRTGDYLWTVILIQTSPTYAELGVQAEPATLRFEATGGGGGDSDGDPIKGKNGI